MFHSSGLSTNAFGFAQWLESLGYPLGNNALQGGGGVGTNPAPTFTAPHANGASPAASALRNASSAQTALATLQERSLKKAFSEGSPGVIGNALEYLGDRGRLGDRALRRFVLSAVAERTDAQAPECLRQVLTGLKTTARRVFGEAMSQRDFALAQAVVKFDPSVAEERHLREAATHCVELGRVIGHLRPDLEIRRPYYCFTALYADHSSLASQTRAEQVASWRQLMERFPYRADEIFFDMIDIDDGSLVAYALYQAPLPHHGSFWSGALLTFPRAVTDSLLVRPEAVDSNLIKHAIILGRNDVLELACKINPKVLLENDPQGNTPGRLAARIGNHGALNTLRAYGVDVDAAKAESEARSSRASQARSLGLHILHF